MSKKWKNKIKKAQAIQRATKKETTALTDSTEAPKAENKKISKVEEPKNKSLLHDKDMVRAEIRKISFIMLVIIIALAVAKITDDQNGWILKAADFIFKDFKI